MKSLAERQKEYEQAYDTKIIRRVPVIIRINGRNFAKLVKESAQPFCTQTAEIMAHVLISLCKQVDGVVFGYQFFDEATLVLQNNQTKETDPWFNNRCQKISSIASSIATYEFNDYFWNMQSPPPLTGAPLFDARVFGVPTVQEAVNNLIWRQTDCINGALYQAAYFELSRKYGGKVANSMLHGRNNQERKELLWNEFQMEFDSELPTMYRRGICCYLVPQENGNKWSLELETPSFQEQKEFLTNIITSGTDIVRIRG